jgi:C4-dicarboxylate-specific signal transduction histidine kinase
MIASRYPVFYLIRQVRHHFGICTNRIRAHATRTQDVSAMSRSSLPHGSTLLVAFTVVALLLGLILVLLEGPPELMILLIAPILFASLYYPRYVHLTMIAVISLVSMPTAYFIPTANFDGTLQTIAALAFTLVFATEMIHRLVTAKLEAAVALQRARDELEERVAQRTADLSAANRQLQDEILERKRAEEAARQRQVELAHAARLSTMGEMASGLAHEINQPLAAIVNYTQGCLRRLQTVIPPPAEIIDAMEQVTAQAHRAGKIVKTIADFVRKSEPVRTAVCLNEIVREAIPFFGAELHDDQATLHMHLAPQTPPVLADRIQIEQVIINLVRNALEAMPGLDPADRKLVIATTPCPNGGVEFRIQDAGHGLRPEVADLIFDPFFTTKPQGMGMGLSIARSIIDAHGGRLWAVSNDPPPGATFHFTLPACHPETPDAG